MAQTDRRNRETPLEAVIASWPKRTTLTGNALFRKIHDAVLKRSGLGAAFKRKGRLHAADSRWLDEAYEEGHRMAFGRELNASERYALYGTVRDAHGAID